MNKEMKETKTKKEIPSKIQQNSRTSDKYIVKNLCFIIVFHFDRSYFLHAFLLCLFLVLVMLGYAIKLFV